MVFWGREGAAARGPGMGSLAETWAALGEVQCSCFGAAACAKCLSTLAAVKVGGRRQPSRRLSTAIPTVASCSRLRPLGKVASPKCFCLGKGESGRKPRRLRCRGRGELLPWGEHSGLGCRVKADPGGRTGGGSMCSGSEEGK